MVLLCALNEVTGNGIKRSVTMEVSRRRFLAGAAGVSALAVGATSIGGTAANRGPSA